MKILQHHSKNQNKNNIKFIFKNKDVEKIKTKVTQGITTNNMLETSLGGFDKKIEKSEHSTKVENTNRYVKTACEKGQKYEKFQFANKLLLRTVGLGDLMHAQVREVKVSKDDGSNPEIAKRRGIEGGFYYNNGRYAAILDNYSVEITNIDPNIETLITKEGKKFDNKYKNSFSSIEKDSSLSKEKQASVYSIAKSYNIDPRFLLASQLTENNDEFGDNDFATQLKMEARRIQHATVGYEKFKGSPLDSEGFLTIDLVAAFSARYSFLDNNSHLEKIAKRYGEFVGKKFDLSKENLAKFKVRYEKLKRGKHLNVIPKNQNEFQEYLAKESNEHPHHLPQGQELFDVLKKVGMEMEALYGIPWQVLPAQGLLESGHGRSKLYQANKNIFGVKGGSGTKKWDTHEYYDGKRTEVSASFRSYETIYDAIYDYANLLVNYRYGPVNQAFKEGKITSPGQYLTGVIDAGYATSPTYVSKANGALEKYGFSLNENIAYNGVRNETMTPAETNQILQDNLNIANSQEGVHEKKEGDIVREYHQSVGKNYGPSVAWCSSFVNWVVEHNGMQGTDSASARSWESWGQRSQNPQEGCVVTIKRKGGSGRHVGLYAGDKNANEIWVLGGNQSNKVSKKAYPKSKVMQYRVPTGYELMA